jgi:subtilase family serine protease
MKSRPRIPFARRPTTPALEELERRDVPSVSTWVAQPNTDVTPLAASGVYSVYTPAQVRHAYGFDNLPFNGAGQTIAIVAAYDDPNAYVDLVQFDRAFGLAGPPAFIKATPQGTPAPNAAWAGEIALDVEWAHVIAPQASILLVEARSANTSDLLAAVDYARNYPRVSVVSMSWGGPEFINEAAYDSRFTTPAGHVDGGGRLGGITFVASAGDQGAWYGPEWPAVSPRVLAVGGTSLRVTSNGTYSSETGWSGSGGGYSKYDAEPSYQSSVQHTGRRSNPDVAYNADPSAGVYVYDSYAIPRGYSGWYSYGGTSAGAPQWAGLIALADQGRAAYGLGSIANAQATIYSLPAGDFHPIVSGYNGYAAKSGYNPVTGRGSPYADRVVWGLLSAGSSTLTVNSPSFGSATGATVRSQFAGEATDPGDDGSPRVSQGTQDQSTLTAIALAIRSDTTPLPVAPPQPGDAVFTARVRSDVHAVPAITRADDVVWSLVGASSQDTAADSFDLLGEPAAGVA